MSNENIDKNLFSLPSCTMTGISNNFNFSFWNTEKMDILSMLTIMIDSSGKSVDRHQTFMPDIRYRLLIEDTLSMLEIGKSLLDKTENTDKEQTIQSIDKIMNEYINLQEYLRTHNRSQLDRIEEKLDILLEKKNKFF